jgi:hypothetical protein
MAKFGHDTLGGGKARTAKEVSDEFRNESPENELLYQEAYARHEADESKATKEEHQRLYALEVADIPGYPWQYVRCTCGLVTLWDDISNFRCPNGK